MVFNGEYLCNMESVGGSITLRWEMLVSEEKIVFDEEYGSLIKMIV